MTDFDSRPREPRGNSAREGTSPGALGTLLRSSTPGFDAGFVDRVMTRIEAEAHQDTQLARVMRGQFIRWAPLGLAASLALAAFNIMQGSGAAPESAIEAALGLEPVTVASVYRVTVPGATGTGDLP